MNHHNPFYWLAGEKSGDLIASLVIQELNQTHHELKHVGIGGEYLKAHDNFHAFHDIECLAVRGYVEVLKHLPRLFKLRRDIIKQVIAMKPQAFIGVDSPDFNLGIAQRLKTAQHQGKTSNFPIYQLVSPSIWAWRYERIHQIKKAIDHVFCLFPFETKIYDKEGVSSSFIGHPLAQKIPYFDDLDAEKLAQKTAQKKLKLTDERLTIALLPGSRWDEIKYLFPVFLATIKELGKREDLHVLIPCANETIKNFIQNEIKKQTPHSSSIHFVIASSKHSHQMLQACDMTLIASGTATLEAMLYKKPMVVAYKMPRISYEIMKHHAKKSTLKYISLPNILCGDSLVPELIQEDVTVEKLLNAIDGQLHYCGMFESPLHQEFKAQHLLLKQDTGSMVMETLISSVKM